MADIYSRPVHKPATRTYQGAVCGNNPSHGSTRYSANGGCVMCAKQSSYDRYQDMRRFKQSPTFARAKADAFRLELAAGLASVREAAQHFRSAKEKAARGAWTKNLRSHGLQPKAIAALRRWLEEKEQEERQAARGAAPRDIGGSWLE